MEVSISDDLPDGTYWSPNDQRSVISKVLSWLKTAMPYTVKVPESEDVGVFFGKIGPSILDISALSQHEIIYPAWYTKRDGQKNDAYSVVHYVQNVVAFENGKEITYLESEPLYNWLKDNEWKKEFIEP
ncbi:BlaR1 peptidase M56 family protein (fragment) [Candidatus Desulfosporosinus infrequens]|uniref:BlaR1 peptidase M56 family protein n=1 Tax=Candidatus Desulfosporosinus infrequens TaxID=2043169 RepID=A0A2U3KRU4_9FIRM